MSVPRADGAPDLPDLPRETADRVLRRAIELESSMGEVVPGEQLKEIARQIGLDPHYLRMALAEVQAARVETPRAHAPAPAGTEETRGRPVAPAVAAMLGGGLLGMLTGAGVGATWSEYAGDAAFLAGAVVFALGLALMVARTLLWTSAAPRPEAGRSRTHLPRTASPPD